MNPLLYEAHLSNKKIKTNTNIVIYYLNLNLKHYLLQKRNYFLSWKILIIPRISRILKISTI